MFRIFQSIDHCEWEYKLPVNERWVETVVCFHDDFIRYLWIVLLGEKRIKVTWQDTRIKLNRKKKRRPRTFFSFHYCAHEQESKRRKCEATHAGKIRHAIITPGPWLRATTQHVYIWLIDTHGTHKYINLGAITIELELSDNISLSTFVGVSPENMLAMSFGVINIYISLFVRSGTRVHRLWPLHG